MHPLTKVLSQGVPPDLGIQYYNLSLRVLDAQEGLKEHNEDSVKPVLDFVNWAERHPAEFAVLGSKPENREMNQHILKAKSLLESGGESQ